MGEPQMSNEHVNIKGLSVRFDEPVLDGVFLKIKKGEFVSLVGKSGVGKSTLLNAIAGFVPFKGDIKKPERIGFVFQQHALFPWMTVKENILFGMQNPEEKHALDTIQLIGLNGKENAFPTQLSGGQQQRVALGRALALQPHLLLLDEPFASLDAFTRTQMQDWVKGVLDNVQTTAVLATHDIDEALLLSDRILVIKNGAIETEFAVPFEKPRENEIRFSSEFQELKKKILASY